MSVSSTTCVQGVVLILINERATMSGNECTMRYIYISQGEKGERYQDKMKAKGEHLMNPWNPKTEEGGGVNQSSSATTVMMERIDHAINASSLNRRASSSSIPDTSAERAEPSYIFMTSGEGGGDRGAVSRSDIIERRRVRPNTVPDILRRKLTIDVDVESGVDGLGGGKVDPLVFSLLRKVVRRRVATWPSVAE
jgi:hypothetical protein